MKSDRKITIILNDYDDIDMKKQIQALRNIEDCPYYKRSESIIAKIMLKPILLQEYNKYSNKVKEHD